MTATVTLYTTAVQQKELSTSGGREQVEALGVVVVRLDGGALEG